MLLAAFSGHRYHTILWGSEVQTNIAWESWVRGQPDWAWMCFRDSEKGSHPERREARGSHSSANLEISFPQGCTSLLAGRVLLGGGGLGPDFSNSPPPGNYNVEQKGTLQVLIKLLKTTDKLSKGLGVLKYCSLGWVGKSLQSYVGAAKVSMGV